MGTFIQSSSSGTSQPIRRYVYLVQDATDAVRMGGTANNTYTTFQLAYNAANALQVALGGSNIVVIQVGNILAGGSLTLTANYNPNVHINGISANNSILGNISCNNASGSGYSVSGTFSNVAIGGIFCNATGPTGNGGNIIINAISLRVISRIESRCTNAANTTGSTGDISITDLYGSTWLQGVCNNLDGASTGNAGSVTLNAMGRMRVLSIRNIIGSNYSGVVTGQITLTNVDVDYILKFGGCTIKKL